jgi:hypothetical protein
MSGCRCESAGAKSREQRPAAVQALPSPIRLNEKKTALDQFYESGKAALTKLTKQAANRGFRLIPFLSF